MISGEHPFGTEIPAEKRQALSPMAAANVANEPHKLLI
jgi:hypothetical protein